VPLGTPHACSRAACLRVPWHRGAPPSPRLRWRSPVESFKEVTGSSAAARVNSGSKRRTFGRPQSVFSGVSQHPLLQRARARKATGRRDDQRFRSRERHPGVLRGMAPSARWAFGAVPEDERTPEETPVWRCSGWPRTPLSSGHPGRYGRTPRSSKRVQIPSQAGGSHLLPFPIPPVGSFRSSARFWPKPYLCPGRQESRKLPAGAGAKIRGEAGSPAEEPAFGEQKQ